MSDKKSSDSRRKLLKSIAAGSGAVIAGKNLPDSWKRPVVDSVMLPVHAQTSPACNTALAGTYQGTGTGTILRCDDVQYDINPPIEIVIGADCSVSVTFTGNRPLTGTGTLNADNTFSVNVSRTEDCGVSPGGNDATGTVTGTVSGTQITGTGTLGGNCDCQTTPARADFSATTTYTADLV